MVKLESSGGGLRDGFKQNKKAQNEKKTTSSLINRLAVALAKNSQVLL